MEPVQKQVITLNHKVDALYQIVAQLSDKMSDVLSECRISPAEETNKSLELEIERYNQVRNSSRAAMEHKDVLVDSNGLDNHHQSGEKQLSSEVQIQRLTAQLTAAYNRIAALEEQLLAQRIH